MCHYTRFSAIRQGSFLRWELSHDGVNHFTYFPVSSVFLLSAPEDKGLQIPDIFQQIRQQPRSPGSLLPLDLRLSLALFEWVPKSWEELNLAGAPMPPCFLNRSHSES